MVGSSKRSWCYSCVIRACLDERSSPPRGYSGTASTRYSMLRSCSVSAGTRSRKCRRPSYMRRCFPAAASASPCSHIRTGLASTPRLKLLHQAYVDASWMAQATMSYDRFCRLCGEHAAVSGATSRVSHNAGRSIEGDWSGATMQLLDPSTGEIQSVFVCRVPAGQPVCARRSDPGCAARVVVARPHINVRFLGRQRRAWCRTNRRPG